MPNRRDESPDGAQSDETSDALRVKLIRAVRFAIAKLAAEAMGEQAIRTGNELRACIVLARLAPVVLAEVAKNELPPIILPPGLSEEEADRLLEALEAAPDLPPPGAKSVEGRG